jgi:hypothetical protein
MKATFAQVRILIPLSLLMMALMLMTFVTARADETGYTLDWWTVDGGGAVSLPGSDGYSLSGTIGQAEAQVWTDDNYTLNGGFWVSGVVTVGYNIYLPVLLRQSL